MDDNKDIGKIINNSFNELIKKGKNDVVKNEDFTKVWCDLSLLPAYRMEYIIRTSLHTQKGYSKNEAIIYGLLMRICKMLCFQRRLVCKRVMTANLSGLFERIIIEGNVNLQYFILNYKDSLLNAFRLNSLKPEAYFEEAINSDVSNNNGEISAWQSKLLSSIYNTYDKAGSSYEEVKKTKAKLPGIRERFSATGNQKLYDIAYRTKCHDIHGDWVDFTQNYLLYDTKSKTFAPDFRDYEADLRQLNPQLIVCCETLIKLIRDFPDHGLPYDLCNEIFKDQQLIFILEDMHVNFLNKRELLYKIESDLLQ